MRLYGVLLLLVTLSAACGLKCYICGGIHTKSCTQTVECPFLANRCGSSEVNGVMIKGCHVSSACIGPIKCCEADLCNGDISSGSSNGAKSSGSSNGAKSSGSSNGAKSSGSSNGAITTGSSVLLLLVSSSIVTLFL